MKSDDKLIIGCFLLEFILGVIGSFIYWSLTAAALGACLFLMWYAWYREC